MQTISTAGAATQTDVDVVCAQPAGELLTLTLGYANLQAVGSTVQIKKLGGPLDVQLRANDYLDGRFQGGVIHCLNDGVGVLQLMPHGNGWHVANMATGDWDFPALQFSAGVWDDTLMWDDQNYWEDM